MTPKEKAEDLILKYSILGQGQNELVKKCALIAANEIKTLSMVEYHNDAAFWKQVIKEIETYDTKL